MNRARVRLSNGVRRLAEYVWRKADLDGPARPLNEVDLAAINLVARLDGIAHRLDRR